jgi:hypothetical protein
MLYGLDTENGEFVASQDVDGGWIITKVNPTFGHHLIFPHRLNTQRVNHRLSAFLPTWSSLLPWPFQDIMSNSMPATGTILRGWHYPTEQKRPCIIMSHGVSPRKTCFISGSEVRS